MSVWPTAEVGGVGGRGFGAVVVALVLLVGCRSGSPPPSPSPGPTSPAPTSPPPVTGLELAVVLPPVSLRTNAEVGAMRDELAALRERFDDELGSVRVVQPDSPAFTADVTELLAERGADLVCVVGPGSGRAVIAVAPSFPDTEFCATPATAALANIPPNALIIDVRVEELAFLAGVAAQLARPDEGPPGFIAGDSQHAIDRRRAAFVAGIDLVAADPVTPYVGFPVRDEAGAYELAVPQYAAGVPVIYTAAGEADLGVRRAAEEAGGLVIGSRHTLVTDPDPDDGVEGEPSAEVLMTTDVSVSVPLEVALLRALGTWEGGRASVGFPDGAFVVRAGGSPRYPAVAGAVEDARARIESGELSPLPAS